MLPPLFDTWLAHALGGAVPEESRSTCDNCAMVAAPGRELPTVPFRADSKCCTYQPALSNFQVGGVMRGAESDRSLTWANELFDMRIAKRVGTTPLGIAADPLGSLVYERIVESSSAAFGRLKEVRCPYYITQGGRCGVWRHRNAVCSTWFCRVERGTRSKKFWRSLQGLLRALERTVSMHAVLTLDVGTSAIEAMLFHDQRPDGRISDAVLPTDLGLYTRMWGAWRGREREFFVRSAEIAGELTGTDVMRIGGPDLEAMIRIAKKSLERVRDDSLPVRVSANHDALYQLGVKKVRSSPPGLGYDPLDLERELFDRAIGWKDRPVADIVGEGVDEAMVRSMLDYGVLVPGKES